MPAMYRAPNINDTIIPKAADHIKPLIIPGSISYRASPIECNPLPQVAMIIIKRNASKRRVAPKVIMGESKLSENKTFATASVRNKTAMDMKTGTIFILSASIQGSLRLYMHTIDCTSYQIYLSFYRFRL